VWWHTPVILALRKLRREDQLRLGYIIMLFQTKQQKKRIPYKADIEKMGCYEKGKEKKGKLSQ
jgi:hypothetical protein